MKRRSPTASLPADLALCRVTDVGKVFETDRPVTFDYIRNIERAPNFGPRFGQDIEPAGRYMVAVPARHHFSPPRGWKRGRARFRKPLVLALTTDPDLIYGPQGWKARLHRAFNAKGSALSCALRKRGYDGIVTCSEYDTREIVDLRPVRCPVRRQPT